MAFTLQTDDGVDNANSYESVVNLEAWAVDRGIDLSSFTPQEKQVALVTATDYLDAKYGARYVGYQLYRLQGTLFPRGGTTSFLRGLPPALKLATCSLAQRQLNGTSPLMPDPSYDASGQSIIESTKKVGPLETTTKYSEPQSGSLSKAREYPEITLMLQAAGIIGSSLGGSLVRG